MEGFARSNLIQEINKLESRRQFLQSRLSDLTGKEAQEAQDLNTLSELEAYSQEVAKNIQNEAHKEISSIVSKCLWDIFGEEAYGFSIQFEKKRGKTEAKFILSRNGEEIGEPMDSSGGGILDIASFALRVASVIFAQRNLRRILVLDEPFKFVSKKYRGRIGQLLEEMSKRFGVQIIMVTHIDELKTGNVVEI